jgi:lipopolysaccharide export system permease protein
MKILHKYIFKQVLLATILGVLLFIVVWISPEILLRIIRQTVYGEITPIVAVKLFFLEIPEILGKAIPVGLLLGSLYVFDRLSKDFELIILRGIGIRFKQLVLSSLFLGIIGAVFCFITYDTLIPYSTNKIKDLKHHIDNAHFIYVEKNFQNKPKQIIIITNFDGEKISNAKVLKFSDNENSPMISNILIADNVIFDGKKWILIEGINYNIAADGVYKNTTSFNKAEVLTGDTANKAYKLMSYSIRNQRELKISQLKEYVSLLKSENLMDEYRYMLNKLYQRYSQAFSCILLVICGVILGFNRPREKRFIGFTVAASIIFIYYMIIPFLDLLAEKGILYPFVAAWLPCAIIASVLAFLAKHKNI